MKELSLHLLDIAMNSVRAGATLIELSLVETRDRLLTITVRDNGCGMDAETQKRVSDPFYTTRTTRSIGMGIPLWKLAAEQTGGTLTIESTPDPLLHGTTICATFHQDHIDCAPLGDLVSTVCTLIQGSPQIDFLYTHQTPSHTVLLDTRQLREVLGDTVPLDSFEVIAWIRENLEEQSENV